MDAKSDKRTVLVIDEDVVTVRMADGSKQSVEIAGFGEFTYLEDNEDLLGVELNFSGPEQLEEKTSFLGGRK